MMAARSIAVTPGPRVGRTAPHCRGPDARTKQSALHVGLPNTLAPNPLTCDGFVRGDAPPSGVAAVH